MRLTEKQQNIHEFICNYAEACNSAPTIAEIQERFHLKSPSTVHQVLSALEKKGFIQRIPNVSRGIRILKSGNEDDLIRVPLFGIVSAGRPIESIQTFETIQLPRWMIKNNNIYALRVGGDSMIGDNLHDGDIILLDPLKTARNGQIVIALINNTTTTLKRFRRIGNTIYLEPRNPKHKTIVIKPPQTVQIQGVLIKSIHSYEN